MQRALELTAPVVCDAGVRARRATAKALALSLLHCLPILGENSGWITRAQMPVALHRMRATLDWFGSGCPLSASCE